LQHELLWPICIGLIFKTVKAALSDMVQAACHWLLTEQEMLSIPGTRVRDLWWIKWQWGRFSPLIIISSQLHIHLSYGKGKLRPLEIAIPKRCTFTLP
jgi:hypothetical protein